MLAKNIQQLENEIQKVTQEQLALNNSAHSRVPRSKMQVGCAGELYEFHHRTHVVSFLSGCTGEQPFCGTRLERGFQWDFPGFRVMLDSPVLNPNIESFRSEAAGFVKPDSPSVCMSLPSSERNSAGHLRM